MVNVTQFRRADSCVTLEVEQGSDVVQRRGYETGADGERRRVDALLSLDEARGGAGAAPGARVQRGRGGVTGEPARWWSSRR